MKIKKKRRITKQELKKDPVEEYILRFFNNLRANPQKWIGFLLIFITLIVLYFYIRAGRTTFDPYAKRAFIQALTLLSAGQLKEAEEIFMGIVKERSRSESGKKSLYYLGHINLLKEQNNEAEKFFQSFIKQYKGDAFMKSCAYEGLALVSFSRGEKKKLEEYINKAQKIAPFDFQKAYYAFRSAYLFYLLGDYEKSFNLLEENKELLEKSEWVRELNQLKSLIDGVLSVSQKPPLKGGIKQ